MFEARKDLSLSPEALAKDTEIAPPRRNLQRHRLAILVVIANSLEDEAHPSAADFAQNPVGAHPPADASRV
jgi:hypothetical protein